MTRFIKNVLLFFIPILLVIASVIPFYFVVKGTGELDSIDSNAVIQRENHDCVIGLGYNEQTSYYKLINADYYKAPIISLGTSRVMQFKKDYFANEFYNCGGAVSGNYNEYKNFLENLNYTPDVVIVGLDAWVFNDAWNGDSTEYDSFKKVNEVDRGTLPLLKSIILDWVEGKWAVGDLENFPNNIGFNGRVKDDGFMYDGSYYYGELYRDPTSSGDYMFVDTKNRIEGGHSRFEWGEHIDNDTLIQLENLLSYCKEKGINVIGFLAPFAPSIYDIMDTSGHYGYLGEIAPSCIKLFRKYGFEFYDYMDGSILGMTDDYFIDGFHGSELVYGRILEKMYEAKSELCNSIDLEQIRTRCTNPYSGYVSENPFNRGNVKNPSDRLSVACFNIESING